MTTGFWQILNAFGHFSYTRLIQVPSSQTPHTVSTPAQTLFSHRRKKSWPNKFDCSKAIFVVTREKPAVSYLSVSARIRVIDSQMKREYGKMLNDADLSAIRIYHINVPSQSFALYPPGNFSRLYLIVQDNNLLYAAKNLKSLESTVNAEIPRVYNWLIANKLSLNIKKSNPVCHFQTKTKKVKSPSQLESI